MITSLVWSFLVRLKLFKDYYIIFELMLINVIYWSPMIELIKKAWVTKWYFPSPCGKVRTILISSFAQHLPSSQTSSSRGSFVETPLIISVKCLLYVISKTLINNTSLSVFWHANLGKYLELNLCILSLHSYWKVFLSLIRHFKTSKKLNFTFQNLKKA